MKIILPVSGESLALSKKLASMNVRVYWNPFYPKQIRCYGICWDEVKKLLPDLQPCELENHGIIDTRKIKKEKITSEGNNTDENLMVAIKLIKENIDRFILSSLTRDEKVINLLNETSISMQEIVKGLEDNKSNNKKLKKKG